MTAHSKRCSCSIQRKVPSTFQNSLRKRLINDRWLKSQEGNKSDTIIGLGLGMTWIINSLVHKLRSYLPRFQNICWTLLLSTNSSCQTVWIRDEKCAKSSVPPYLLSIRTSSYLLFLIAEKKYFLISKKKAGEPYGAILAFSFQVYKAVCLAVGSFHNAIKYGSLLVVKWPLRPPQRPPCA